MKSSALLVQVLKLANTFVHVLMSTLSSSKFPREKWGGMTGKLTKKGRWGQTKMPQLAAAHT